MSTQQTDPATHKQEQREYWNRAAGGWRQNDARISATAAPVTRRLLQLAGAAPGLRILDIASGAGEPALPAAQAVGPAGHVLLTDQSREMLAVAREKAQAQGLSNVDFRLVDGEELDVEAASFDAVTCRWGLMFMPEPVRCLRAAWNALKPGGRIAVAVWGPPHLNPFITVPVGVLIKSTQVTRPAPGEPGVFAFAERSRLAAVLSEASFRDIVLEDMELPMAAFSTAQEYWESLLLSGPIARDVAGLSPELREKVRRDLLQTVAAGDPGAPVSLNGYTVLASASRPLSS